MADGAIAGPVRKKQKKSTDHRQSTIAQLWAKPVGKVNK
jgi:hypothetical protein